MTGFTTKANHAKDMMRKPVARLHILNNSASGPGVLEFVSFILLKVLNPLLF